MIKSITVALALMLTGVGVAYAGSLTQGLDVAGGKNTFAQLALERADLVESEEGVIRLQMTVSEAQELKGYGFVLKFDPTRYEFVEAKQTQQGILGGGDGALFVSSNKNPGEVTVGAMKIDGNSVDGSGAREVRLTVYNLLGQEIRTLVDGQLDAGYHTIVWDGMDDAGRQVASGVYVYRMHSGNFSAIRRMMLLK